MFERRSASTILAALLAIASDNGDEIDLDTFDRDYTRAAELLDTTVVARNAERDEAAARQEREREAAARAERDRQERERQTQNSSNGSSSNNGNSNRAPERCYAPGGKTWEPC